ncbi:hypothetical protein LXA43DRAFT_1104227 [Ganoderma leucocontextum]|nr:hypothetical protein LXA43DRAFT_1104227 [Ganoderma leucocontextum]
MKEAEQQRAQEAARERMFTPADRARAGGGPEEQAGGLLTTTLTLAYTSNGQPIELSDVKLQTTCYAANPANPFIDAILSHCPSGGNPHDLVSLKIRNFWLVVWQYGYDWFQIDSCCIDKSSSAELSEVINSMFRWYSLAETCDAYLADAALQLELVPLGEDEDPNLDKVIDPSKGHVVAKWREVYICALQLPYHTIPRIPVNRNTSFYVPRWFLKQFGGQLIR